MENKPESLPVNRFHAQTDAHDPLYVRLKETIKREIMEGKLLAGSRLPSTMEMAVQYGVCHKTVQLTMKSLTGEGLIVRRPHHGTFVAAVDREALLKGSRKNTVALLMQYVARGFASSFVVREMIDGVMSAAEEAKCQVNFHIYSDFDTILKDPSLTGFLLMLPSREEAVKIKKLGLPTVLLDIFHPRTGIGCVLNDEAHGIYLALQHLVDLGHRRILYAYTEFVENKSFSGQERFKAFKTFTELLKLPSEGYTVQLTDLKPRLTSGPPFTAIVTDGYTSTLYTLKTLYDQGLRIPDDVSFVGYDDLELAEQLRTPITVVKQNLFEVGRKGMELLLDETQAWRKAQILIKPELILRQSTLSAK